MPNFTSNTYQLKRQILNFSNKISSKLSKHLNKGTSQQALHSYLSLIRKWVPDTPVIHIDDSDVVKPSCRKFEDLGFVRDGSKSTQTKNVNEKGYHVTEATVLTNNGLPVSLFSEIHSSKEKDFTSINTVTFSAMECEWHNKNTHFWRRKFPTLLCLN